MIFMTSTTISISIAMTTLAIGLASSRALAQPGLTAPPLAAPSKQPPPTTTSYGLQIFFADAILAAAALGTQRAEPAVGLLLTGTVIHALHGRGDAAVGSALLRVTLPLLGLMVGVEACDGSPPVNDDPVSRRPSTASGSAWPSPAASTTSRWRTSRS